MSVEAGQRLLHYRLIDKIGEGGMGVVWRAEDTTLRREVAIKILPDAVGGDPARLARFAREARLLATLNHPNIAAVYGLHEAEGVNFLAMELVRGEDLSERIARGALPVDEALEIAKAVAEALRSAHASDVIHRDLKPANIRIGPEGEVKVLDFGLAKALSGEGEGPVSGSAPSMSPTITSLGTVAGVLLGTAAYMSPEQARGSSVDKRADIWAFGCVLYEMLTGSLLFPGETITDTLAAVVRAEPDWDRLPANLPVAVRKVLELCLAKNPRERLHHIADATLLMEGALDDLQTEVSTVDGPKPRGPRWREGLAWALALSAVIATIALALRPKPAEVEEPPVHFTIRLDTDSPLSVSDQLIVAYSPDGRTIAFEAMDPISGRPAIYLRALDEGDPWLLGGTEGGKNPFFSHDGENIGFFSDGRVKQISRRGGSAIAMADAKNNRGAVWLPDNSVVYSPEYNTGLWRVSASGGTAESIVEPDRDAGERTFRWPALLPDGKTLVFTVGMNDSPNNYDHARIAAYTLGDSQHKILFEGANMARFAPPDKLAFTRAGSLYVIEFDPERVETVGQPVLVMEGVGGDPSSGAGYFDLSRAGDLVYVEGAITAARSNLVLIDRGGERTTLPIEPRGFFHPRFSPDGESMAFAVGVGSLGVGGDIWVYSFRDEGLRRVSFGGSDIYPLWRPDGVEIAFVRSSDSSLASKAADGSGDARVLIERIIETLLPDSWTPDHSTIALSRTGASTDVELFNVEKQEFRTFVEDASAPAISPDGRWLAYASPASGNSAVYVRRVDGDGKWQVSPDIGGYPRWSADGRKLFYIDLRDADRPVMEVDVAEGDMFRASMPRVAVADTKRYQTATSPVVNWDTDGERFAFVELMRDEETLFRVEVTLGWARQLRDVSP